MTERVCSMHPEEYQPHSDINKICNENQKTIWFGKRNQNYIVKLVSNVNNENTPIVLFIIHVGPYSAKCWRSMILVHVGPFRIKEDKSVSNESIWKEVSWEGDKLMPQPSCL